MNMAVIDTTGKILPTPGSPVPLLSAAQLQAIVDIYGYAQPTSAFVVRALSTNSIGNKCYLINTSTAADTVEYSNVLWYFEVPNEAISFTSGPGTNVYQLNLMYVDCDQAGDGLICTYEIY